MGAYDNGFGVNLIATWLATLLAGIGLTHGVHYFAKFSNDIFFKKALVGVVLLLVFLELGMECAETYLDVVTHWGNPVALYFIPWPHSVFIFCSASIGFIVDQFLIHRFYAVSKNIWITIVLSMCNLVLLVMGFIVLQFFASSLGQTLTPEDLHKLLLMSDVWAASTAVTDVAIAASLVWVLRGMKTSFKDTNQLIQHIMAVSIQNGCTTSAVAIGGLVADNLSPETSIGYVFYYTLGPLYLITLLSNLTLRQSAPVPVNHGWSSYVNPASRSGQTQGSAHFRRSVATTGGASTIDVEANTQEYAESTVRGTSDDIEAGRMESGADQYQNAEKLQARPN
ncbi:hypothetical protein C8R46DRAFT_1207382 [Mycena filopes]|nr:hypothetical protein C8R46DRAFT_1207382 [Mycena filopes]